MSVFQFFVTLTIIAGCCALPTEPENVVGNAVAPSTQTVAARAIATCDGNNTYAKCKDPCNADAAIKSTVLICHGADNYESMCSEATPFCTDERGTAGCSAKEAPSCSPATAFQCPGTNAYYPDHSSCSIYYICGANVGGTIQNSQLNCPAGYVFDITKGNCKRSALASDCYKVDCTKTTSLVVAYTPKPSIYWFCISGKPVIMKQCPLNEVIDVKDAKCKFICKTEGNFQRGNNCGKTYYSCARGSSGTALIATPLECPDKSNFNATIGNCDYTQCPPVTTA